MAEILWQRTVVRDGWHNMCTDLCFWQDSYWLTFRRGSYHVSPEGGIVVMRSVDLKRWREVAFLKTRSDDRDPKIVPTKDKLYVYFGTWHSDPVTGAYYHRLVNHVSTTEDCVHWSDPGQIYEPHIWLWRVRLYNGTFYSAGYGWEDPGQKPKKMRRRFLDLLSSPDGLVWKKVARIAQVGEGAGEADLLFRPGGELWCISRSSHSRWRGDQRLADDSFFYISKPPYKDWERINLKVKIHCPVFCETGGKVYLAGRRDTAAPWISQSTPAGNTAIFLVERGKVKPFLALPTDGDAAYPGLISREPGKLLISYYSQHAYRSGVVQSHSPDPSDIYIAEIAT